MIELFTSLVNGSCWRRVPCCAVDTFSEYVTAKTSEWRHHARTSK